MRERANRRGNEVDEGKKVTERKRESEKEREREVGYVVPLAE